MTEFRVYRLPEEYEEIRVAVRAVCDGKVAAAMTTRATRDGDARVLDGAKRWITNAGVSDYSTVFAVTDPSAGSRGIRARRPGRPTSTRSGCRPIG